jgi:hypothetical protein
LATGILTDLGCDAGKIAATAEIIDGHDVLPGAWRARCLHAIAIIPIFEAQEETTG